MNSIVLVSHTLSQHLYSIHELNIGDFLIWDWKCYIYIPSIRIPENLERRVRMELDQTLLMIRVRRK